MIIYTILNKLDQSDWSSKSVKKVRENHDLASRQSIEETFRVSISKFTLYFGCKGILMAIFQAKINDRSELVSSSNYARLMDL